MRVISQENSNTGCSVNPHPAQRAAVNRTAGRRSSCTCWLQEHLWKQSQWDTAESEAQGFLTEAPSQQETRVELFVCLIKARKAHVSTELQHLQQNTSKFEKHSPNPLRNWNPRPGLKAELGLCAPVRCAYAPWLSFRGISQNSLFPSFSTEGGDKSIQQHFC